ncbi:MAG: cation:proton antiporter [Oscillospiraceae bacterium]|nr:cation:proton antiporter [Oscillospiraceae bacterium]MDY6209235.1 cation:proton antiporter [Oscillospiraceae bacterium]
MLFSLAVIFLVGLSAAEIVKLLKLPRIIGMLAAGIVVGPYVLDLLDPTILGISSELRQMALIIILVKAGLSLDLSDLKKVGRPAVMMSFVPACFEILGYVCFAPYLFEISRPEAAVMGAVLSAVSPAVVVPRMVKLIEDKYGTEKSIPQMILAGASCDDIFVITLFSAFAAMAQGGTASAKDLFDIPISIVLGVVTGAVCGYILYFLFDTACKKEHNIRNSVKVIIILAVSFLLMSAESLLKGYAAFSGLLAVVAMACIIKLKTDESVWSGLAAKFGKLWIAAEVLLFVLVGAAVDIRYTLAAGGAAAMMIFIALAFRSVGVLLCLLGTKLSAKERLFCVIAYLPKATVQAAIGSVPLAMGLPCGKIVLSVSVLAIIITAPLGAMGIDRSYKRLLEDNSR